MKRVIVAVALACGCAQHPAITAGVAGGSIGLLACEINSAPQGTCAIIGGGAALFLGGIAAVVTYFFDTSAHGLPPDEELLPNGAVRVRTHTEPPPVQLDAGTPPVPVDAAVDAPAADAP